MVNFANIAGKALGDIKSAGQNLYNFDREVKALKSGSGNPAPGAAAPAAANISHDHGRDALMALRLEALQTARDKALAEHRQPSLIDYYVAAEELGQSRGLNPRDWNEKVYANLSDIKPEQGKPSPLTGFIIREHDVAPSQKRRESAIAAAVRHAPEGIKPNKLDVLKEMQVQQAQADGQLPPAGVEALEFIYDLDCTHEIGRLYHNTEHQSSFKGTVFENCTFHPAGMLMQHEHDGAVFNHCTFDGMEKGDKVVLKQGTYNDITLTNLHDGELTIGDGDGVTHVNGLHLAEGSKLAKLNFDRTVINDFTAKDSTMVEIHAKHGTVINQADFTNTTLSMVSTMKGVEWNDPKFTNVNLHGVDMHGGIFNNPTFTDCDLKGLDLRGVVINGGQVITNSGTPVPLTKELLTQMGVQVDNGTKVNIVVAAHHEALDKREEKTEVREEKAAAQPESPIKEIEENHRENPPAITAMLRDAPVREDKPYGTGADAAAAHALAANHQGGLAHADQIAADRQAAATGNSLKTPELKGNVDPALAALINVPPLRLEAMHVDSVSEAHDKGAGTAIAAIEKPVQAQSAGEGMSMNALIEAMKRRGPKDA
jgi:uncharacterized protein YjbI with pentapeptide repeats